ncbi:putative oxidoreductase [Parasphingorhabdus marina DSM 22363]|uniref:Putative oxidoreductase n=1 Tax=Parasphingorhabdus marina DSM 22363 TaxID=1123272 RepID=A0A1N6CRF5_9SPHN|nr:DoxX family protein [Parasphingorhabdus marina]SIN61111.1 putative oxidoreductase [Parasphingorhabdus marina DSM 22363]
MMKLINKAIDMVSGSVPEAIALLFTRVALAGIFWRSARTKVEEGTWLQMSDTTVFLFQEEYGMPFPEITGLIATYAEHFLPILVVLGLFTRVGAAGLLVMTLVIQFFVYPDAWWVTHIVWVALASILIVRGGGLLSVDRLLGHKFG